MDNRVFNVNGRTQEMLAMALSLAFKQEGDNVKAKAWRFIPNKGLVLLWSATSGSNVFPAPMEPHEVASMAMRWLQGDEAKNMTFEGWDEDHDHDGHNELGWRVYVEEWGHVGSEHYSICAIRPAWMWYGK